MSTFSHNGVKVKFPFPPYDIQKDYMSKVIDAINNKDHEKFKESAERFFKQYSPFTGRNVKNDTMSDFFTERTTIPWMIMNNYYFNSVI